MSDPLLNRRRLASFLSGLMLAGAPLYAEAKGNCDAQGGLFYLGNTSDDSRSIWLSATSAGAFRLDAAQGNTTVDEWTKSGRGLNITASPFVSSGNGGVHKLYDTSGSKDCLMDSQNQKGGVIPPHIVIPTIRPNGYFPLPRLPTIHPTGYIPLPDVPTIHPTGYIPLPDVPTIHPTGYIPLPDLPIPPIPPRPPGPTPPGPTPPSPTPIGPTPPDVTPGARIEAAETLPRDERRFADCPDARTRASLPPGTRLPPECLDQRSGQASASGAQTGASGQVPITPGRDVGVGVTKEWNVWADANFVDVSDGRYGLDVTGWSRVGTVGMDRRITSNAIAGVFVSMEQNQAGGYGGFFSSSSWGPTIGPYAAMLLSDSWSIDGSLGYSRLSNDLTLAVLQGSFVSQRLSANLNLHAQYDLKVVNVRPRLTGNYMKTFSDAYSMQGTIVGRALSVTYGSANYDYASMEFAAEFNKLFTMKGGDRLMPFAEFGMTYEAVRPNGGQILTSDLQLVVPSPWSMQARAGVRMLISNAVLLEARAGYLSFGQSGLDVVEARLNLSFSF